MNNKPLPGYQNGIQSELLSWVMGEMRKRAAGQENEIDFNEILAAKYGVKNKWTKALNAHPEVFKNVGSQFPYDWEAIVRCQKSLTK